MLANIRRAVRFKNLDDFDQAWTSEGSRWRRSYLEQTNGGTVAEIEYDISSGCIELLAVSKENQDRSLELQMVNKMVQHVEKEQSKEQSKGQESETNIACVWLKSGVHMVDAHMYGIGISGTVGIGQNDSWPLSATSEALKKAVNPEFTLDSWYTDPETLPPWV